MPSFRPGDGHLEFIPFDVTAQLLPGTKERTP